MRPSIYSFVLRIYPLFSLLIGAKDGAWPLGQGCHTNAPRAAPGTVFVGLADLVALNRLRVMAGQQARPDAASQRTHYKHPG